jgi:hypothetical protein
MGLFDFFQAHKKVDRVEVTDDAVIRYRAGGKRESVKWADLGEVAIMTTDEGPLEDDVFWVLTSLDGRSGCLIPQGIQGESALLPRLQSLSGFDNQAVINASLSTSNQRFVCWKKAKQ